MEGHLRQLQTLHAPRQMCKSTANSTRYIKDPTCSFSILGQSKHLKGRSVPPCTSRFCLTKDFVVFLFLDTFRTQCPPPCRIQGRSVPPCTSRFWLTKDFHIQRILLLIDTQPKIVHTGSDANRCKSKHLKGRSVPPCAGRFWTI